MSTASTAMPEIEIQAPNGGGPQLHGQRGNRSLHSGYGAEGMMWISQVRQNAKLEGWSWALRAEWRNLLLWLGLSSNPIVK